MDEKYTLRLEKIETELNRWLPDIPNADWIKEIFPGLGDMVEPSLIQALTVPGKDLIERGGKRWRPLLMTLICEALGGGDEALPLVPLVEFSHNASLIHDDIEDNSVERRGKPAIHITYGIDTAINSGSFLFFLSLACIDRWPAAQSSKARVYKLWASYMRKLHLGQAMDIYWHRNFDQDLSIEKYYTMCNLKTGCLARFAAELGSVAASIAGAAYVPAECIGNAAEKLGVGFQILDDVKNLTVGIPGKRRGDDIVERKKSLPVLLLLHHFPEKKELVRQCFIAANAGGVDVPEVETLIQAMYSAGVLTQAEDIGKALIAESRDAFFTSECSLTNAEGRSLLVGLINYLR